MAKYTITYNCGHEGKVELFGPMKDREQKIAFYEKRVICPECYKKAQEEEAKKEAEELNLPLLEGSEKQVAWAEKIRHNFMSELKKQQESTLYQIIFTFFAGQTSAKFWIDNRDKSLADIVRDNREAIIKSM